MADEKEPQVLFQDNHLLAVIKPPLWVTQGEGRSCENWCRAFVKKMYNKKGEAFVHAVHRLDRPVRGIVLFAKTSKALSRLQEAMRQGKIEKIYLATVENEMPHAEGVLEHYLAHGSKKAIVTTSQQGKLARLSYKVVAKNPTQLRIVLLTGRYHQIRAQCSAVGCPIVGDVLYGANPLSTEAISLSSAEMHLQHPVTQEPLHLSIH